MIVVLAIFIALIIAGRIKEELDWSDIGFCTGLIIVSFIAQHQLGFAVHFLIVVVALIDILLLFKIFKGSLTIR